MRFAAVAVLSSTCCALSAVGAGPVPGQDDSFFSAYLRRATATQAKQPGWSIPLLGPPSVIAQNFRQDISRSISRDGTRTWNIGGGRGVSLIVLPNMEVDINPPAYFQRSSGVGNGIGDFAIYLKYRLFTAPENKGNYSSLVGLAMTLPTGNGINGATETILAPNLAFGKGWGKFDVQTSASIVLPMGRTSALGRQVTWTTLGQYKVGRHFWPEVESSTTFFQGGPNQRNVQSYVLPGVMSKFKLHPEIEQSRLALVAGAGMQFAVTSFHGLDHVPVCTMRMTF